MNNDKTNANGKHEKIRRTAHGDPKIMKKSLEVIAMRHISTDPNGSYTGVCKNIFERPTQDADDL